MRISDWSSDVCSSDLLSEGIPDKTSIQILQWMSPRIADRMVQWFVPRQMAKGVYERNAQHRADYLEQGVWSSLASDAPFHLRSHGVFISLGVPDGAKGPDEELLALRESMSSIDRRSAGEGKSGYGRVGVGGGRDIK